MPMRLICHDKPAHRTRPAGYKDLSTVTCIFLLLLGTQLTVLAGDRSRPDDRQRDQCADTARIDRIGPDQTFHIVKEFHVGEGVLMSPKENSNRSEVWTVSVVFVPRDEKPVYTTESRWYDPDDKEYRIVRKTYDRLLETKKGIERPPGGTTRVHSIPIGDLYDHKPGLWKVDLHIDNQLAGKQTFLVSSSSSKCPYFKKRNEPPPLPPIEEVPPRITMKSDYFKFFPWADLAKPRKDGNDPYTILYTIKDSDTLEKVAEAQMGNPNLAAGLAAYNDLTSQRLAPGDKIVIPNPIIGIKSEIIVKSGGQSDFTSQPFDLDLEPGQEYKLKFESNVNGYAYILREGLNGTELLYPAPSPAASNWGKVAANQVIEVPTGNRGFTYDPRQTGNRILVFLSLRQIPDLDELRDKTKLQREDAEEVMHRVRTGEVFSKGPLHLLRIHDSKDILGFLLNISGQKEIP